MHEGGDGLNFGFVVKGKYMSAFQMNQTVFDPPLL